MANYRYYEVSKDCISECGNIVKAIENGWFMDWKQERIKAAFNWNNGTEKDLFEYVSNNKPYLVFLDLQEQKAYNTSGKIDWTAINAAITKWEV